MSLSFVNQWTCLKRPDSYYTVLLLISITLDSLGFWAEACCRTKLHSSMAELSWLQLRTQRRSVPVALRRAAIGNELSPTAANGDSVAWLSASITVWLWSFMHILRSWAAVRVEALVISEASYGVVSIYRGGGGGVAGALITYIHRVIRRWGLSKACKKRF